MQDLKPCHIRSNASIYTIYIVYTNFSSLSKHAPANISPFCIVLQRAYLDLGKGGVTSMWIAKVFYILYDEATGGCILGTIVHQAAVLVLGRHEATALALKGRAWKGMGMDGQKLRINRINPILKKTNAGQTLVGNILIQFAMSYYIT